MRLRSCVGETKKKKSSGQEAVGAPRGSRAAAAVTHLRSLRHPTSAAAAAAAVAVEKIRNITISKDAPADLADLCENKESMNY